MPEILQFHANCTVSKRIKDLQNHKLHKSRLLIIRSCIPDKISFIKMFQNTCRIPFLKKILKIPRMNWTTRYKYAETETGPSTTQESL